MNQYAVYQQKQGASFLLPDDSVKEVQGSLVWVGRVWAATGSQAIDKARELSGFSGWLPSRLEAYPVVEPLVMQ